MEDNHRKAIQKMYSSLVEQTDLDSMVTSLFEKRIFSEQMIEPYKITSVPARDRKQQLYRDVTHRGPRAFSALLEALTEAGLWHLVREMDPNSPYSLPQRPHSHNNTFLSTNPKPQDPPKRNEFPSATVVAGPAAATNFKVIKSTEFKDGAGDTCYRTRGRFRGVLLVFSYEVFNNDIASRRRGADKDSCDLKYLFEEMGLKSCCYTNLTERETRDTLEGSRAALEGAESVFVVVSSHGYARDHSSDIHVRCSDGKLISALDIIDYFNNLNAPRLIGVPKVFIFQVCRGDKADNVWLSYPETVVGKPDLPADDKEVDADEKVPAAGRSLDGEADVVEQGARAGGAAEWDGATFRDQPPGPLPAPVDSKQDRRTYSDILIAHSTVPGYVSARMPASGSLYVQAVCAEFASNAHRRHVLEMFGRVDASLRVQTSSVDSWGFNKKLYLHPGLFDDH